MARSVEGLVTGSRTAPRHYCRGSEERFSLKPPRKTPDSRYMGRLLSQDEIDKVFRNLKDQDEDTVAKRAAVYDFRRPDRIAKDQLRSIHLLLDNFARNLASSLSGYLRAYVM